MFTKIESSPLRWFEVISAVVTALTAVIMALVASKKYLREEHIVAHKDRKEVFHTTKQTTELRATENGLELHLHDIRPGRGGLQWTLPPSTVEKVLKHDDFSVEPPLSTNEDGHFTIGNHKRWLYSRNLYPDPAELKSEIRSLLEKVIELRDHEYED
jgi:hypothetical protein